MKKIIKNAIKCKLCGDIIESTDRHNYVECKCGASSLFTATQLLKRGNANYARFLFFIIYKVFRPFCRFQRFRL